VTDFIPGEMVWCIDTRSLSKTVGIILKRTSGRDSLGHKYYEVLSGEKITSWPCGALRRII